MKSAEKTHIVSSAKRRAETPSAGRSLPAVPVLQQKAEETEANANPSFQKNETIQRVQYLWTMPDTGDAAFDSRIEESRRAHDERIARGSEERREEERRKEEKAKEERDEFFLLLLWDLNTTKTIAEGTEWNHANRSGTHGGSGLTGQKGKAIWMVSRNDRDSVGVYAGESKAILVYQIKKSLKVAILPPGEQVFPRDLVHWQREFPEIEGVLTDHGKSLELVVFDAENVTYKEKEMIG